MVNELGSKGYSRGRPEERTPTEKIQLEDRQNKNIKDKLEKFLKGVKVSYEIPNLVNSKRTYRINGFGPCPNSNYKFESDKKLFTIINYFLEQKKYKIKYPNLPSLWVGATNREQKIYLPSEVRKSLYIF